MKLTLSIKDRLTINQLYPREGNLITQTLVRDITEKLRIGQEEMTKIGFKAEIVRNGETTYIWNPEIEPEEFEFTENEINLLKKQVEHLNSSNKIIQEILDLCLAIKNC